MNKYYSSHRITDGKWEVVVWIREDENYTHDPIQRPDLRDLINKHYNASPIEMARAILETVLHAEKVQVDSFGGKGVYVER